jgi:hypothetical protein
LRPSREFSTNAHPGFKELDFLIRVKYCFG